MRQLILVTDAWHPQVNGVVTTLQKMVDAAEAHGWQITVIHPGLFKTIPTPTYPEIRTAINPWKIIKMIRRDVDSIHIATEGTLGLMARMLCWKRDVYFTSGFHTNFPDYFEHRTGIKAKYFYPFFRFMHDRSKAVMVPSLSTKLKLEENGFSNVILWGRGFDESVFYPGTVAPARENLKVLYVGRVAVEKNLEELLDLSNKYDVTIVGDGPDRKKLEKKYPNAHFLGYKKDHALADCYRDADVFAFPSTTDTFGVVMIEAMACGIPVAAHNVEGPRDAVDHKSGGILGQDLEFSIIGASRLKGNPSVLANASKHTWAESAKTFFSNLVDLTGRKFTCT